MASFFIDLRAAVMQSLDVFLQDPVPVGMPQLAQCLGFDLADPLTGDIKDLADLLKGFHASIIKAITQA